MPLPSSTAPSSESPTWRASVALAIVLAIVAWFRLDPLTRGTLWAEDGLIFLAQRESLGPWRSIVEVYAGYLHVVPRLLTEVAVLAPVEQHAVVVTALCCLLVGGIGGLVHACTRGVIRSPWVRVALAATTVLVPVAPFETLGNLANLHWYLLWLTPWLLLARPSGRLWSTAAVVVAVLVGLSEIQAALFLPLAVVTVQGRRAWPPGAGLAAGALAQTAAALTHPRPRGSGDPAGVVDIAQGFLVSVVLPLFGPSGQGAGGLLADHGWVVPVLLALPFLLAGVVGLATSRDGRAALFAALLVGAIVPFVVAVHLNRSSSMLYDSFTLLELSARRPVRYGVVPAMFLVAMVLCWVDGWSDRRRGRVLATRAVVVVVLVLQVWHLRLDETRRSDGPGWSGGVERAQQACREGRAPAPIPAAPGSRWAVPLDCAELGAR